MSTRTCPKCGSKYLVRIATQYLKICNECGHKIEWLLDKGQQPLITNNRIKQNDK